MVQVFGYRHPVGSNEQSGRNIIKVDEGKWSDRAKKFVELTESQSFRRPGDHCYSEAPSAGPLEAVFEESQKVCKPSGCKVKQDSPLRCHKGSSFLQTSWLCRRTSVWSGEPGGLRSK